MARGGKKNYKATKLDDPEAISKLRNNHVLRRQRKERLEYDTTPAKTVLAIVGVAVAIVLVWLEYQGY